MIDKNPVIIISFIIIFLFSIGFSIQSIYGHTEIKVGNYTIEAGWSNEPPLINNLNEVVIFIFENDFISNGQGQYCSVAEGKSPERMSRMYCCTAPVICSLRLR